MSVLVEENAAALALAQMQGGGPDVLSDGELRDDVAGQGVDEDEEEVAPGPGLSLDAALRVDDEPPAPPSDQPPVQDGGEEEAPVDPGNDLLDPAAFKAATKVRLASRGKRITTIDKWLKAYEKDGDLYAIEQVIDACRYWLSAHADPKKRNRSVRHRHPSVERLLTQALHEKAQVAPVADLADGLPAPVAQKLTRSTDDKMDAADGALAVLNDMGGLTGDYADRNLHDVLDFKKVHGDDASAGAMSAEGGGMVNNQNWDMVEGANMLTGGLGIANAVRQLKSDDSDGWDRAEGVAKGGAAAGSIIHGAYKLSKGVAIHAGKDATAMTQLGDIGAAYADGTAAIAGLVTTVKGLRDLRKKHKEEGGLTRSEAVDGTFDTISNVGGTAYAGTKTALDIIKAGTEVGGKSAMGMSAETAKATISGLSTAAGVIGIVTGTFDVVAGAIQGFRALARKNALKEAQALQAKTIDDVHTMVDEVMEHLVEDDLGLDELFDLIDELVALENLVEDLEALVEEYKPAFDALSMLQNRKMENAAVKAAKGTTAVVSGALMVSGVGAPIGLAVAAVGAIISLGHAGLKLARNHKANTLTKVAQRLSDEGRPKAMPDEDVDYRAMERRVYKAYYSHMPDVLQKQTPSGLSDDEFTDIKHFAWQDKKNRIDSGDKHAIDNPAAADGVSELDRKTHWLEVVDQQGEVTHREKPKGMSKAGFIFSSDAHKSKQAQAAASADVAKALYELCSSAFDPVTSKFVDAPIVVQGSPPEDQVDAMKAITMNALLSAADITESRFAAWWKSAGGSIGNRDTMPDRAKLEKTIAGHVT